MPRSRKRFYSFALFLLLLAAAPLSLILLWRGPSSPNVLFLLLDAARADRFSCYGYPKNTTPCIDAISSKGALFLSNFVQATHTRASVPRIFFSRYFSLLVCQTDAWQWNIKQESHSSIFLDFDKEQIFLPKVLSRYGYRTAFFHNHAWFTKESYIGQQFDELFTFKRTVSEPAEEKMFPEMFSWLERHGREPFFLYCHLMSPHCPYPPKEEDGEFLAAEDPQAIRATREKFSQKKDDTTKGWTEENIRILRGLYEGNLKHSDRWVGALFEKLTQLGLAENTLIVITSDHGESLGEHECLGHGCLPWDSIIRVPLILYYPPRIPEGIRVSGLTESVDIMPTILEICKTDLPHGKSVDGTSLLQTIGNPEKGKEAVFSTQSASKFELLPLLERYKGKEAVFSTQQASIRTAQHKYIFTNDLLYDLRKDPREVHNISGEEPAVREKLRARYEEAMEPYKNRFQSSKRETPPDFPFYFNVKSFLLTPRKAYGQRWDQRDFPTLLKEAPLEKSWLLIRHGYFRLLCLPSGESPPPVTLRTTLPDGFYRVDLLVESKERFPLSPEEIGLRYRFDSKDPFAFPKGVEVLEGLDKIIHYVYLNLGKTAVRDKRFSVEIDFFPSAPRPYSIRHVRFTPPEHKGISFTGGEEARKRIEDLKALGYYIE